MENQQPQPTEQGEQRLPPLPPQPSAAPPQAAPAPTPAQPLPPLPQQPRVEEPKKSRRLLIGGIITVVLAALIGGGTYAYTKFVSPNPSLILKEMTAAMQNVKSFHANGSFTVQATSEYLDKEKFAAVKDTITGFAEVPEEDVQFQISYEVKADEDADEMQGKLVFDFTDVSDGMIVSVEGMSVDDHTYVKIGDLAFMEDIFDLSFLTNKWIDLEGSDDIADQFTGITAPGVDTESEDGSADEEDTDDEDNKHKAYNDEFGEEFEKMFTEELFSSVTKLKTQTVDGVPTHHYGFEITKDTVERIYNEGEALSKKLKKKHGLELPSKEETEEADEAMEEFLEEVRFMGGELWIGKRDNLLYGLSLRIDIDADDEDVVASIIFATHITKHNQPVSIEAPKDALTVEKVMELFFQQLFMGGLEGDDDSSINLLDNDPSGNSEFEFVSDAGTATEVVPTTEQLTIGTKVQALWHTGGGYWGATIEKINDDGTYFIRWDDGTTQDRTKLEEMTLK